MAGKHVTKAELKALHQPKGGAKEKGCLTRHQRREDGHKCSHQWQAKKKAEANSGMYNYPAYQSICGDGEFKTQTRETDKGIFPRDYGVKKKGGYFKNQPTKKGKEWNLGVGGNFDHFIKPYWHNAHHIVPNGSLKASINKTGKTDSRLPGLIKQGLLRGEYNLNDKVNMVILPQERIVAEALGLPRHLKGDEVGPDEDEELYSHEDYSDRVELKLDEVMMDYEEVFSDFLLEDHPEPPDKLSKAKINKLSRDIFKSIKNLAKKYAGKALSDLPHLVK
jgi:HNH/ENDO VII superfamily nuclease